MSNPACAIWQKIFCQQPFWKIWCFWGSARWNSRMPCTRSVRKPKGLVSETFYFNFKKLTTCIFLSFFAMLLCNTGRILLGCLSAPLLWTSWWPPRLQNESSWSSLWSYERENSHTKQNQWNVVFAPVRLWSGTAACSAYSALLLSRQTSNVIGLSLNGTGEKSRIVQIL